MLKTLEELSVDCDKASAQWMCKNVMARYMNYYTAFRMADCVALFADRADTTLETQWGCYDGIEGVKRCYLKDHGDRNDPTAAEALKGCMMIRSLDTEAIIVAGDGQTARAVWMAEGAETYGMNIWNKEYACQSFWYHGKYSVDFILENGEWKIWHLHVYNLYRSPCKSWWTICGPYQGFLLREPTCDRSVSKPIYNYSLDIPYPENEPAVPYPYETFADVEPGYGYTI